MAPASLAAVLGRRRSARKTTAEKTARAEGEAVDGGRGIAESAAASTVSGPRSGRKRRKVDDDTLKEIVEFVKRNRPSVVSAEEKLDILLLQAKLRHEHYALAQDKAPKNAATEQRRPENARATHRIAGLLNRKPDLVAKVWSDYCNGIAIKTARPPGNYSQKSTLVPRTQAVIASVHGFVRERRVKKLRIMTKDIMDHLEAAGYIAVNRDSSTSTRSTLRSVHRFLNRIGYTRGAKKGMLSYKLREENSLQRDAYLARMTALNQRKDRRIVYVGESYMYAKYTRDDGSLFGPNDEQDLDARAAQDNGKRYCFIAAIVDANHQVPVASQSEYDRAHLLRDTLIIFEGGKKQTKDFRGMFHHNSFLNWMEALFAALRERGIENAAIVMDDSKHHRELPAGTPNKAMKREEMQQACSTLGIAFEDTDLRSMLWGKLSRHIQDNVEPMVSQLAAEKGHEVVFSPPHHSELQPIDNVWSAIKGEVGRQYTVESTFEHVNDRLQRAFDSFSPSKVQQCIADANKKLEQLMAHVSRLDDMEVSENDDSDEEEEGSGYESTGFEQHIA